MWAFISWLHWWDGAAPSTVLARNVRVMFRPAITVFGIARPRLSVTPTLTTRSVSVTFTAL